MKRGEFVPLTAHHEARTFAWVGEDGGPLPCPDHPDVFVQLLEDDETCSRAMALGGVLHAVCFYG